MNQSLPMHVTPSVDSKKPILQTQTAFPVAFNVHICEQFIVLQAIGG